MPQYWSSERKLSCVGVSMERRPQVRCVAIIRCPRLKELRLRCLDIDDDTIVTFYDLGECCVSVVLCVSASFDIFDNISLCHSATTGFVPKRNARLDGVLPCDSYCAPVFEFPIVCAAAKSGLCSCGGRARQSPQQSTCRCACASMPKCQRAECDK